jgi:hypothetical protein
MTAADPWQAVTPSQLVAQVPRKIPGGPVVRVAARVYRGRIVRRRGGRPDWDYCPHNHTKRTAAVTCGEQAARRLNKLAAKPGHDCWPAENTARNRSGFRVARWWDAPTAAYPMTAACQPCGRPITCPAKDAGWAHTEEDE